MDILTELQTIADNQVPGYPRHITIVYHRLRDNDMATYEVAPTNVRYSRDGKPLLVAVKRGTDDIRTFRVDMIKGVKLT